jgi:hypothetical protein
MFKRSWISRLFGRAVRPFPSSRGQGTLRAVKCGRRLGLEALEDRLSPATLAVNSSADTAHSSDPYLSLREAISIVNRPTLPTGLSDQILGQIDGDLHAGGTDSIVFDSTVVTGPIVLAGTQLELSLPSSTATVTIDGGAGVTLDGNHASLVLQVDAGAQVTLDHLAVSHGYAPEPAVSGFGAGISNSGTLTVTGCTLSGNTAFGGGGIANAVGGTLTVSNSTLRANSASFEGGGIHNYGTLTVSNSTLSANSARTAGGGIFNNGGTLTVSNSTLSANSAITAGGGSGGGIANAGTLTVSNSTLSANSAYDSGGGILIFDFPPSVVVVQNTIVAGNSSTVTDAGPDIYGAVDSSSSYNLVGIGDRNLSGISDGSQGNQVGTPDSPIDPLLGPLSDYGGPTQTMPLLPGSPALNTGDPSQAGVADQRGPVRSGGVNIGAFQASTAAFVVTAPDSAPAGMPFDVLVAAVDSFGQLAVGYTGTIHCSSSDPDPGVVLPLDYTFQASDGGMATFPAGVTLFTPGNQTVMVTDLDSGITGSTTIAIV